MTPRAAPSTSTTGKPTRSRSQNTSSGNSGRTAASAKIRRPRSASAAVRSGTPSKTTRSRPGCCGRTPPITISTAASTSWPTSRRAPGWKRAGFSDSDRTTTSPRTPWGLMTSPTRRVSGCPTGVPEGVSASVSAGASVDDLDEGVAVLLGGGGLDDAADGPCHPAAATDHTPDVVGVEEEVVDDRAPGVLLLDPHVIGVLDEPRDDVLQRLPGSHGLELAWLAGAGLSPRRRLRRRCGLLPGKDTGNLHQPGHRLRGLGPLADPFERPGAVDLDEGRLPHGVVAADVLDEPPVPRRSGVGDDHAVAGLALLADATKSDLDHGPSVAGSRNEVRNRPRYRPRPGGRLKAPRRPFLPPPFVIDFIILRTASNCLSSSLTSRTWVPDPRAIRARRAPEMMRGSLRSPGVIDRMMASSFTMSLSSMDRSERRPIPGRPGSILTRLPMPPILRTCCIWDRKSSSVKAASRILRACFSASSLETAASAFSIRVRTSPIPRMREAMRSGWNGSRSASFSPMPANLIGWPVTVAAESAAPPLASPSSFVMMMPVSGIVSAKAFAETRAAWPVVALRTNRT